MIPILDNGYIKLIEFWGSDERIIEAARMSTQKGFLGWGPIKTVCPTHSELDCPRCNNTGFETGPGDEKLLAYLYNNKHMTPFEMAGMTIEVQAPIFVFREWHRHRTQSYNEMSARYTPLPNVNYIPTIERLMLKSDKNKQAQGTKELSKENAKRFIENLDGIYIDLQSDYEDALNNGIPKELARLVIPVGRYSRMRASANLRNWLQFLTLRMDEHAQWEIRQYANEVGNIISQTFPRTWNLFRGEQK